MERVNRDFAPVLAGDEPDAGFEQGVKSMRGCAGSFEREVGAPPTRRLEGVRTLAIRACTEFHSWGENLRASLDGDPGDDVFAAESHAQRAEESLGRAAAHLNRLIGDGRPLPVRRRPTPESHIAPPYGRAGGVVSHREDLEARCWSEDDWGEVVRVVSALDPQHYVDYAGIASPGDERVSLAPEVCAGLALLVYTQRRPTDDESVADLAFAVETLAHESVHVRAPGLSEAEVECAALQEVRRTAVALGATAEYAKRLAEAAWTDVYPQGTPEYFTEACRDGGPLDANPGSSVWP